MLVSRLAVADNAQDAGRAAVHAIECRPVNSVTVTTAYAAAAAEVAGHGEWAS